MRGRILWGSDVEKPMFLCVIGVRGQHVAIRRLEETLLKVLATKRLRRPYRRYDLSQGSTRRAQARAVAPRSTRTLMRQLRVMCSHAAEQGIHSTLNPKP